MDDIHIEATPDTVHWGYLGADIPPVAHIDSGARVTISTVSGLPEVIADSPYPIPPALASVHKNVKKRLVPGHICTGPIAVQGARRGDVLQVDIEDVTLDSDWAYTGIRPLKGALPDDFDERQMTYLEIDRVKNIARTPWGMDVPLRPFFGVLCTAPPSSWGELSTVPPRRNGGNIDNRELVAGSTLYLPVYVDGALFSAGDGHGAQGDGEICTAAVEMGMRGTFKLTVRKDMSLEWPLAETDTHIITMAFDPDLDDCVVIVVRRMIDLLEEHCGLSRADAYTLLSYAGDLRVTQVVNGNKGIHLMLNKDFFHGKTLRA
jgi:acetamidase/formamidase